MFARTNVAICTQYHFVHVFIDQLGDDEFVFAGAVGVLAMIRFH